MFQAQCDNPVDGDWVTTVKDDLKNIDLDLNFSSIKQMSKSAFKKLVRSKVRAAALKYLTEIQATHSKAKHMQYKSLKLQNYLRSGNMTIQDKCFTFAARSHMLQIKCNFKNGISDIKCRKCGIEDESQKHVFQ